MRKIVILFLSLCLLLALAACDASKNTSAIMMFGDSIIRGVNSDGVTPGTRGGTTFSKTNIPNLVADELGCVVDNYAIGSIGWLEPGDSNPDHPKGTAYQYLQRVGVEDEKSQWYWKGRNKGSSNKFLTSQKPWSAYNTVILAFGANDRTVDGQPTTLGSIQDLINGGYDAMTDAEIEAMEADTIVKAMYQCYRYIRKVAPTINIILSDPLMQGGGTAPEWSYPTTHPDGDWTWYELCDLYAAFAKRYGLGHMSHFDAPINRIDPTISLRDGVHPTTECYRQLARHFAGKISSLVL